MEIGTIIAIGTAIIMFAFGGLLRYFFGSHQHSVSHEFDRVNMEISRLNRLHDVEVERYCRICGAHTDGSLECDVWGGNALVKRTITFTCPRCSRTYMNATSETVCEYCKDYDNSKEDECHRPIAGDPNRCAWLHTCWQIFGEKLGCQQNPKNQNLKNGLSLNEPCHRKLELP